MLKNSHTLFKQIEAAHQQEHSIEVEIPKLVRGVFIAFLKKLDPLDDRSDAGHESLVSEREEKNW